MAALEVWVGAELAGAELSGCPRRTNWAQKRMFLLDIAIFRFHVKCKECSQQQEALILWHIDRMKKIQEHGDVNSTKFEFYRQNCRWNQNKTASQEKYLPEIIFKHCLCTKSNIMRIWHQSQQNWCFELNHWSFFEIQVAPFKNPWHFLKMDRSGAGVNPTARWYSVLHLSSNFWAKGTQFPTPADPEGFFRRNSALFMAKWDFSGLQQFPKAYFEERWQRDISIFQKISFHGGQHLWRHVSGSESESHHILPRKRHFDDRGASFRVKLFGWPRRVTIMVMSPIFCWWMLWKKQPWCSSQVQTMFSFTADKPGTFTSSWCCPQWRKVSANVSTFLQNPRETMITLR